MIYSCEMTNLWWRSLSGISQADRDALKKWRKPLPPQKGGIHGGKKGKKGYDRKREKRVDG